MGALAASLQGVRDLQAAARPSATWAPPRGPEADAPPATPAGPVTADPVQAPSFDRDDALALQPLDLPKLDTALFRNAGLTQYVPDLLTRQVKLLKSTSAREQFANAIYSLDRLLDLFPTTVNTLVGTTPKDVAGPLRHDRTLNADKRRKALTEASTLIACGRTAQLLVRTRCAAWHRKRPRRSTGTTKNTRMACA